MSTPVSLVVLLLSLGTFLEHYTRSPRTENPLEVQKVTTWRFWASLLWIMGRTKHLMQYTHSKQRLISIFLRKEWSMSNGSMEKKKKKALCSCSERDWSYSNFLSIWDLHWSKQIFTTVAQSTLSSINIAQARGKVSHEVKLKYYWNKAWSLCILFLNSLYVCQLI